MPVTQQGFIPSSVSVTIAASTSVKITHLALTTQDTEYSLGLTSNLKQLKIKNGNIASVKIAFTSGESGTKYFTIPGLNTLNLSDLDFTTKTLYAQCTESNKVIEILELSPTLNATLTVDNVILLILSCFRLAVKPKLYSVF